MRLARSTSLVGASITLALLVVVSGARAERRRAQTAAAGQPARAASTGAAAADDRVATPEARRRSAVLPAAPDASRRDRPALDAPRRRGATAARALARVVASSAAGVAVGLLVGLLLALTLPLALGMRPLVVVSGSMDPTLRVGDVTVVARIAPREARVGEVVTFRAPETGRLTTHRLRAVRRMPDGRYAFTTKGDANNAVERWTLPADGELSRAVYRIPAIGRALLAIRTPIGWTLLVGLPLLVLGSQEIARTWRPRSEKADAVVAP